jgi:methionyl aminopeptidase
VPFFGDDDERFELGDGHVAIVAQSAWLRDAKMVLDGPCDQPQVRLYMKHAASGPPIHNGPSAEKMRAAGRVAAATLQAVEAAILPGVSAADIDALVRAETLARGATPNQLGFQGFPAAVCVSPNAVVCHGIPHAYVILQDGDIVNVDVTSCYQGYHGDTSRTFVLGRPPSEATLVTTVAREALSLAIGIVKPGIRVGDIGALIESYCHTRGCSVVREYGGHGIGKKMHMPPHIPHHGYPGTGPRLVPGMTFTIEPMVTVGSPSLRVLEDGWTVVTADGSPSAQFEHTVRVTTEGCEILTRPPGAKKKSSAPSAS